MPGKDQRHYGGDYKVRARRVREAANADPTTRCWRPDCRLTMAELQVKYPKRRIRWTAGHTIDGDPFCLLLAECSPCNFKHGQAASMVNRRSSGGTGRI